MTLDMLMSKLSEHQLVCSLHVHLTKNGGRKGGIEKVDKNSANYHPLPCWLPYVTEYIPLHLYFFKFIKFFQSTYII